MWVRRLLQRITERRQSPRVQAEGLVAYYWTGSVPKPKVVRDIGLHGAYIFAADTFYPRTVLQIIFEDADQKQNDGLPAPHICVCGRVCRKTPDGFCVAFLFSNSQERLQVRKFLNGLKRKAPGDAATVPNAANVERAQGACEPSQSVVEPEEAATPAECKPESERPERPETGI